MINNVGMQDKVLRLTIGLFFMITGLSVGITSMGGVIILLLGLIAVVTGAIGFCPLYKILGLNTGKSE